MTAAYDFAADIIAADTIPAPERVAWRPIQGNEDPNWHLRRVLYAYVAPPPHPSEILYIGKAWNKTVAQRFDADDKQDLWRDLWRQRDIDRVKVIVGRPQASVLTHPLLSDLESLLIYFVQPWGNDRNTLSRGFSRAGFGVDCAGAWPLPVRSYVESVLA